MIKTGKELAAAAENVARNYKTLYVMGCFGAPLTGANVERYCKNHKYNRDTIRTAMIKAVANQDPPYYGFDCCGLIKGLLWGWSGNPGRVYGGADYACNGVSDYGANQLISRCTDVSTDFSNIAIGEAVWMDGHIGIYIGEGKAVESTPKWANGVQITSCNRAIKGLHRRNWTKHGKLQYVEYSVESVETPSEPVTPSETVYTVRKGDTLGNIAKAHGTTWEALAEYNGLKHPNLILPGQKIKIPGADPSEPEPPSEPVTPSEKVYTVRKGDTLGNIAKAHGTTWEALAEYNGLKHPNLILPGQQIKIPG